LAQNWHTRETGVTPTISATACNPRYATLGHACRGRGMQSGAESNRRRCIAAGAALHEITEPLRPATVNAAAVVVCSPNVLCH
jgi:hypothetical protein